MRYDYGTVRYGDEVWCDVPMCGVLWCGVVKSVMVVQGLERGWVGGGCVGSRK